MSNQPINENWQAFLDSVEESLCLIEDFGGWSNEYIKYFYGTKRNKDCVLNRVRDKVAEFEGEPTEYNFKQLWRVVQEESAYVEQLRDELQEKQDNIPESFQGTDSYETREEAIGILDNIVSDLEDALGEFKDEPWAKSEDELINKSKDETIWERVARQIKDADKCYDLGIYSTEEWKAKKKEIAYQIPENEPFPRDFNK